MHLLLVVLLATPMFSVLHVLYEMLVAFTLKMWERPGDKATLWKILRYPIIAHKLRALLANRNRQLIGCPVYMHMQSTLGTMYIHVPVLWCSFTPFGCSWNPEI